MELRSEYHRNTHITYLCKLVHAGTDEPGAAVTFDPITYRRLEHWKKRVGQPLSDLWVEAKKVIDHVKYTGEFDFKDARHKAALTAYAKFRPKIKD